MDSNVSSSFNLSYCVLLKHSFIWKHCKSPIHRLYLIWPRCEWWISFSSQSLPRNWSVLHFSVISDKLGLLSTYRILVLDQEPRTKCIKNFYYSRVCHCTGILLIWLGTQMSFFLYQHLMLSMEAAMLEINWPCRSLCCYQQVLLLSFFLCFTLGWHFVVIAWACFTACIFHISKFAGITLSCSNLQIWGLHGMAMSVLT